MSWVAVVLGVLQAAWSAAGAATVGDTVVLMRSLPAPAGATARTQALQTSDLLEPLGPPETGSRNGVLQVVHRVAFFRAGTHRVPMPTVEVVAPDGHVEMILGDTATVRIASVLPDTGEPAPRWSRAPLARPVRRPEPLVVALLAVVTGLALWALARRRTQPRPSTDVTVPEPVQPPLMQWLSAGEPRAVATLASDRLRRRIAEGVPQAGLTLSIDECVRAVADHRPDWPVDAIQDMLAALERARFSPLVASDAMALTDRTEVLLEELTGAPPEPADEPAESAS